MLGRVHPHDGNDRALSRGEKDATRALAARLSRISDELTSEQVQASQDTRYAKSGDISIAYQVIGSGPDIVLVPGSLSHIELGWSTPASAAMYRRLSRCGRLITFDKRGTGLSDRTVSLPTLEERMDDVRAVMDAARSERAAIVGVSEGGPMALLFAATYPERVTSLALWVTFARMAWAPDYPIGLDVEEAEQFCDQIEQSWGHGRVWPLISVHDAPDDEATRQHFARFERAAATPAMAAAASRFGLRVDARDALSSISAPTLVVHRAEDPLVSASMGRYLAEHIRGATYSEYPGAFHFSATGKDEEVLDEIEEFLTGTRAESEIDRVLKTILFTDIADSTARAVEVGDRRWRDLLDAHDSAVREEIERYRGQEVKTTGDGFLVSFDGPARAIRCALAVANRAQGVGLAQAGEILVTSTVRDLVAGSGLGFEPRGGHELKGLPGEWQLLALTPD
jgi:pimeloyl-ACP methyl ester carboxylesterase